MFTKLEKATTSPCWLILCSICYLTNYLICTQCVATVVTSSVEAMTGPAFHQTAPAVSQNALLATHPGFHRFPLQLVQILSHKSLHIAAKIYFNSNRQPHYGRVRACKGFSFAVTPVCSIPVALDCLFLFTSSAASRKNTVTFQRLRTQDTAAHRRTLTSSSLSSQVWLASSKPHVFPTEFNAVTGVIVLRPFDSIRCLHFSRWTRKLKKRYGLNLGNTTRGYMT